MVKPRNPRTSHLLLMMLGWLAAGPLARGADENDFYRLISVSTSESPTSSRSKNWKPAPHGLALEVSGLTVMDQRRVAVAIRKGEIWMIDGVLSDTKEDLKFHRYASGLHEPLGLVRDGEAFLVAQRTEVTRVGGRDKNGIATDYLTAASGWAVTGNYHAYTYGPERDGKG